MIKKFLLLTSFIFLFVPAHAFSIFHIGVVLQSSATTGVSISSSTTSSSFIRTGFKVTITPKFSSSLLRITLLGDLRTDKAQSDFPLLTIERNQSNTIAGGTNAMAAYTFGASTGSFQGPASFGLFDSPASVAAQTYEVYIRNTSGGSTVTFCSNFCSLIVEEIGQ